MPRLLQTRSGTCRSQRLSNKTGLSESDITLSLLRRTVIGGSACPPALLQSCHDDHHVEQLHAWGMTGMRLRGTMGMMDPPDVAREEPTAPCDRKTAKGQVFDDVVFVKAIPLGAASKILKKILLREQRKAL